MAEDFVDPRECAWHPRFSKAVLGHDEAQAAFHAAVASGKPHHAWLLTGPSGIGKATLAYTFARSLLGQNGQQEQARHWIDNRAHPDLAVLERSATETKPRRLRSEIVVDDARRFMQHFGRTAASGGWRVGIVDAMDDLNTEAANALLKLIEEPPNRAILLLVCHQPGRILRTLRSRCLRVPLSTLGEDKILNILNGLPLEQKLKSEDFEQVAAISGGSPGRALTLLQSVAAKAFSAMRRSSRMDTVTRHSIASHFAGKTAAEDYAVFMDLLLEWIGEHARTNMQKPALARAYGLIREKQGVTESYNLDRKTAVLDHLVVLEDALKAA